MPGFMQICSRPCFFVDINGNLDDDIVFVYKDGEGEEVAEELEDVDGQTAPGEQVSVVELYAR